MDKLMSQQEVKRAQVLELLKENKISQQEASKRLNITTRQMRHLTKRYQTEGSAQLIDHCAELEPLVEKGLAALKSIKNVVGREWLNKWGQSRMPLS